MRTRNRHERGVTQVFVVMTLTALVGLAALAVDTGFMVATRSQLQHAADATALGVLGEVLTGALESEAVDTALLIAGQHDAGGESVSIEGADVEFGSFDFVNRQFVPDDGVGFGITAVRITLDSSIPLFFGGAVGFDSTRVGASAVAAVGLRDLTLVQDVTLSFEDEIGDVGDITTDGKARTALATFADAMASQNIGGDRLGLVTFNEAASRESELVDLGSELTDVIDAIQYFEHCTELGQPDCGGTHIAPGLREAIDAFADAPPSFAERVILLVSDGVPCVPGNEAETEFREQQARDAADEAADAGISIFTIFIDQGGPFYCEGLDADNNSIEIGADGPEFLEDLVTGFGGYVSAPSAEDLDQILVSILRSMPLRLVR